MSEKIGTITISGVTYPFDDNLNAGRLYNEIEYFQNKLIQLKIKHGYYDKDYRFPLKCEKCGAGRFMLKNNFAYCKCGFSWDWD